MSCSFDILPCEIRVNIFSYIVLDEVNLRLVCKYFNETFSHPYILNFFQISRKHLLGKYHNFTHLAYGIFPFIKRKLETVEDYKNDVEMIRSLKLYCWGNEKHQACPPRNSIAIPGEVKFPKGEKCWHVSKSHEYCNFAITLSGKCYSWGGYGTFGKSRSGVPIEGVEFNEMLESTNQIPVNSSTGYRFTAVQTHIGNLYMLILSRNLREGPTYTKINTEEYIEHVFSGSFCLWMVFKHEMKKNVVFVEKVEEISSLNFIRKHPKREVELRENENIKRIEGGYNDFVLITDQNRLLNFPEFKISPSAVIENVVDFSGSESIYILLTKEGKVYGNNAREQRGKFKDTVGELGIEVYDDDVMGESFGRCELGLDDDNWVIAFSHGVEYYRGGHTLFMDKNRKLYHTGCNTYGEHLVKPDQKRHGPKEILKDKKILFFTANENFCSVICY